MTEQELKEKCMKILKTVLPPSNEQECVRIATDFAERLFIADYFSKENRTNFIKKELCSYFNLTEEQTNKIIERLDLKEAEIQDKLQIQKFKCALKELPIFEDEEFFRCNNILEVKKIVEYIKSNYTFYNQNILKSFIQNDLCSYFQLTQEERKEIMELI